MNDPIEFAEQAKREEAELWNPQLRDDRIEREITDYHMRAIRGDAEWVEHLDDREAAEAIAVMWTTWLTNPKYALVVMNDQLGRLFEIAKERHTNVAYQP